MDSSPTPAGSPGPPPVTLDHRRMGRRLAELAGIGAIEGTDGAARLALTDEDRRGRDLVVGWMRELGLAVRVDEIGNVVAVMGGFEGPAPVLCGSHIDTVRTGGRYDGNLGVIAGLEVIAAVQQAGITPARPLGVAVFTDEEGSRYPPDMLGSLVYVGGMDVADAHAIEGIDGTRVGEELAGIGYLGDAECPGPVPHAFVELHIEQGPVLEAEAVTLGAVTEVQGISWLEFTVRGQSNHAGTTPMVLRRDPAVVAASATVFVRDLADEVGPPQVGTVGRVELHPNLVNVVAASATFTVDLRHTDDDVLHDVSSRVIHHVERIAEAEGCEVEHRALARFAPVQFDPRVVDVVEQAARRRGHSVRRMPSGAGHDAQMLARVCPAAMIFTPSRGGISHNPAEYTDPDELAAGADVLADTMLALTEMPLDPVVGATAGTIERGGR